MGGHYILPEDSEWVLPNRTFDQNKFYCVTGGKCEITIGSQHFIGERGDWFVMPANVLHSYRNLDEGKYSLYYIHFDLYPSSQLFSMSGLPYRVQIPPQSRAWQLFESFAGLCNSKNLVDRIRVKALLLELISEYIALADARDISVKSDSDTRIDKILRYINDNLSDRLTLGRLSAEFHLHPNHFIRFFKQKTGHTPAKYIKLKKMETAKRYLEETDLNVSEIMARIGESDLCGFSKQFKSFYTFSPANYRKYFNSVRVIKQK